MILCWWPLGSAATRESGPWIAVRVIGTIGIWGNLTMTGWPAFRLSWKDSVLFFGSDLKDMELRKPWDTGVPIGPYSCLSDTGGNLPSHPDLCAFRQYFNYLHTPPPHFPQDSRVCEKPTQYPPFWPNPVPGHWWCVTRYRFVYNLKQENKRPDCRALTQQL